MREDEADPGPDTSQSIDIRWHTLLKEPHREGIGEVVAVLVDQAVFVPLEFCLHFVEDVVHVIHVLDYSEQE